MVHIVDLVAYSFLAIAMCVAVFQRMQGELDAVSFAVGRGFELLHSGEVHPKNSSEGLAAARQMLEALNLVSNPNFNFDINKIDINNAAGEPFLNVRVYNYNSSEVSSLRGVLVWYHGGGWVQGNIEGDDAMCIRMASITGFVVVSVNYRMAPEFPYPVPLEDSIIALNWVAANIHKYGGDGSSLFVCGESAGGNLAAAVVANRASMLNENKHISGSVLGLLMVYPSLDNKKHLSSHSFYNTSVGLLSMSQMSWFRLLYSGNNHTLLEDDSEYLFAPLYAPPAVLGRFPPTVMVLARHDVLLDEGVVFAQRLQEAGVSEVHTDIYNGTIHGFFGRRIFPQGFRAMDNAMERLMVVYAMSKKPQQY